MSTVVQGRAGALAFVGTSALLLGGCGDGSAGGSAEEPDGGATVRLEVTAEDWNGWEQDAEPEPVTGSHVVGASDSVTVDTIQGEVEITVVSVTDDEVTLETSEEMAPTSGDGGWDFNDTETAFTLERGDELEIVTPTMDAGTVVTITEQ
jgi:hypothetical protein